MPAALRALMAEIADKLDLSCLTVTGKTLGENIAGAKVVYMPDVIHTLARSDLRGRCDRGAHAAISRRGGCVMKPAAAEQRLLNIAAR